MEKSHKYRLSDILADKQTYKHLWTKGIFTHFPRLSQGKKCPAAVLSNDQITFQLQAFTTGYQSFETHPLLSAQYVGPRIHWNSSDTWNSP